MFNQGGVSFFFLISDVDCDNNRWFQDNMIFYFFGKHFEWFNEKKYDLIEMHSDCTYILYPNYISR